MKQYLAGKIRNVALAGHGGCGKTSLAEALLFKARATDRLGKIADGNTVCDFDAEEIKRKVSVSSAVAPLSLSLIHISIIPYFVFLCRNGYYIPFCFFKL